MSKLRTYKKLTKSFLVGLSITTILPGISGCSNQSEEVVTEETQNDDWLSNRKSLSEKNQNKVVLYFEDLAAQINENLENLDTEEMKKSAKESIATTFITMTDFLFYGGEISYGEGKTITFDELSLEAQEKIELIYSTVDSKIESYWPGYKDDIEKKYEFAKGYITEKANALKGYLLNELSRHMTEENYEKAGTYWELFKEQTKEDLETGKDTLTDLFNKGKDYADEKYQDWKTEYEEGRSR